MLEKIQNFFIWAGLGLAALVGGLFVLFLATWYIWVIIWIVWLLAT